MTSSCDVDRGWAWWVLGASYFCGLFCSGLAFVAGMFQVLFLQEFEGSVAFTAWVTSLFSSLMQLGGPMSSLVFNIYNCRTAIMLGGCLTSIGLLLSGLVNNLGLLFVFFGVVAGAGIGLTYTASVVVISFFFRKRRTLVNGIVSSSGGLGILLAPQLSRLLFDNFSWRETLFILAGVSAHICIAGALMFPVHEKRNRCTDVRCLCNDLVRCRSFNTDDSHNEKDGFDEGLGVKPDINGRDGAGVLPLIQVENFNGKQEKRIPNSNVCVDNQYTAKEYCVNDHDDNDNENSVQISSSRNHQNNNNDDIAGNVPVIVVNKRLPVDVISRSHDDITRVRLLDNSMTQNKAKSASYRELFSHDPVHNSKEYAKETLDPNKGIPSNDILSIPQGRLVAISKNPSVSSLISSTHHLEIVVTNPKDLNTPDHHNTVQNFIEQKINLNGEIQLTQPENPYENAHDLTLLNVKDIPLYKNRLFTMLCFSMFVANAAGGVYLIYIPSFLKFQGLSEQEVTNTLSMNGIGVIVGRCLLGALANSTPGHEVLLIICLHILGGLVIVLHPVLCTNYVACLVLMFFVSTYCGTVPALLPTLTIQYVGLKRLPTAFGMEMVCCGAGFLVSPPLAGILVDITQSYDYNLYCGGGLFIAASLVMMALPGIEATTK